MLNLDAESATDADLFRIRDTLARNPGVLRVELHFTRVAPSKPVILLADYRVTLNAAAREELAQWMR